MDIKAFGKINLSLDITGILPNGYHSVSMLMQSVDLCDVVSIEKSEKTTVTCDNPAIPTGKENIAYKACELMIKEFSLQHGFAVKIKKNIPIAGGMAGGSTDAAAVMRGINDICKLGVSPTKLMELSVSLGADVPFCIQQKPAHAEGIGEKLTSINGLWKELYILLVNPNVTISTKDIYQKIDAACLFNQIDNNELISAIDAKDFDKMRKNMKNVMQNITEEMCPEVKEIIEKLYASGAKVAMMSGSGATCFGIFENTENLFNAQKMFNGYFTAIAHPIE